MSGQSTGEWFCPLCKNTHCERPWAHEKAWRWKKVPDKKRPFCPICQSTRCKKGKHPSALAEDVLAIPPVEDKELAKMLSLLADGELI